MNGKRLVVATVAATALALAGAASGDDWRADATAKAAGAAERAQPQQTRLKLKRSPYGKVLFANGYAIYKFTAEKGSESQCYGECAEAWPPLDARGEVVADDVTEFGGDWLAVKRNGAAAPH